MELITNTHKRNGLIGTILFHVLLLILFILYGLVTPLPRPISGVTINFGLLDQGMGDIQPEDPTESAALINPQEAVEENVKDSEPDVEDDVLTQNQIETIELPKPPEKPKKTPQEIAEERKKQEAIEEKRREDEIKKNLNNIWANAKSNTGEGNTNQPGDQGDPDGDKNSKNHLGDPGAGGAGGKYNLAGRSTVFMPKIKDRSQEDGKVIVDITVDRNGNVIRAVPGGQGSNTTSTHLYKKAKEAALKTKFSANPNAPEEQKGTMTFIFILE